MSLTAGHGPLSKQRAGRFNFEPDPPGSALYFDPVPYRVRALVGGETVADSRRAKLLHETGHLPVYYFPREDVREDLLEPTETHTTCPYKGEASYWTIRVDGEERPDAVWGYPEPRETAPFLAGHVALYWEKVDTWLVEDDEALGHPRDPYHRIDVFRTSRHLRVLVGGEVVADTRRARLLIEAGLPPRWYIPREDVRTELLEPSEKHTRCAYKGVASYWHVRAGGELHEDVVWTYPEPERDGEAVRDLLCFFDEHVDVEVDGERQERPETQWSR